MTALLVTVTVVVILVGLISGHIIAKKEMRQIDKELAEWAETYCDYMFNKALGEIGLDAGDLPKQEDK